MDRYLNVTEARRNLLDLVERLHGGDRVVITKRGRPRAVLVDSDRYALLEDLAWALQDPGRRAAMHRAREEMQRGELVRLVKGRAPAVKNLRRVTRTPSKRRAKV